MDDDDACDTPEYRYPREYLSAVLEQAFPESVGGAVLGADRWARFQGFATHEDDGIYGDAHEVQFQVIGDDDHMADDTGRWLDRTHVQDAVDRILSGDVVVADAHREQIRDAVSRGEALDPDVADLVIQVAEFGAVRHAVGWRPDMEPPRSGMAL